MFLSISEFIGHFHPVLVHLPIGILLISSVFFWLAKKTGNEGLLKATDISLLIGMISAVLSCISGYLLSQVDDYDEDLVSWHQWMGISVAIISVAWYILTRKKAVSGIQVMLSVVLFFLIILTGHLGGSLTHGSDYLTSALSADSGTNGATKRKPIPNVQEAVAYTDIIQPIFQSKCYSCHGSNKQKGKLRVDQPELLMKGGKNGEVILPGKAGESELMKRLLLERQEEHHMPPKEKAQLNDEEMALIHWWIATGASFDKKVKDADQPEKLKPVLLALQKEEENTNTIPDVPQVPVEKAGDSAIARLKAKGIVIMPVSQGSNYLMANFVTASSSASAHMELLLPLKKQLVWLKLGSTSINDSALRIIGQFTTLTKLQLNNTKITDMGLPHLKSLANLQYLNLVGTQVTAEGILQLKELKQLQSIYLYQTNVDKAGWVTLKKSFPTAKLDSGGYIVPILVSDTTEVKREIKPK